MINRALMALALAAGSISIAAPASAAVTVGLDHVDNCYPFSCLGYDGLSMYQQVYSASAFSGPITINRFSHYLLFAGDMDIASYEVSFYLTSAAVSGLSTTPGSNRGTLLSNFGTYSLSGAAPSTLSFTGNSFVYNPAAGNLLMQVRLTGYSPTVPNYIGYFQADDSGTQTSRYYGDATSGVADGWGLVTTFDFASISMAVVPEPGTWLMLIAGFGVMGASLRRRPQRVLQKARV